MKNHQLFVALCVINLFFSVHIWAQAPQKHVLLEHFTNTRCSVCASRNPAFYTLINNYPTQVHHISYHPSVPYETCVFYQANTTQNDARADYYDIQGTPRVALNGNIVTPSVQLLPETVLTNALNQTSAIALQVSETTGNNRTVTINVATYSALPSGNYRLYAAIAEKNVNYNAPNGETLHHDVFRQMLPNTNGISFTPANEGQSVSLSFDYTVADTWNANETYIVAFVQNDDTKEILNSGTKFDPPTVATSIEPNTQTQAHIYPNPTNNWVYVQPKNTNENTTIEVFDTRGSIFFSLISATTDNIVVNLSDKLAGIYFLRITNKQESRVYTIFKY